MEQEVEILAQQIVDYIVTTSAVKGAGGKVEEYKVNEDGSVEIDVVVQKCVKVDRIVVRFVPEDPELKKGFVFVDNHHKPFLCRIWGGELWLFYWHADRRWVSLRKVSRLEADCFPRNLTAEEQQAYLDYLEVQDGSDS